jgi:hypothetical protein
VGIFNFCLCYPVNIIMASVLDYDPDPHIWILERHRYAFISLLDRDVADEIVRKMKTFKKNLI